MTEKEKQLLVKDLCARLPYGVIVKENDGVTENDNKLLDIDMSDGCINYDYIIEDIKPYLRPMSSITEEEKLHVELTYGFFYHDGVLDNVHIFEAGGYYDRDGNYDPPCEYRERRRITIEKVFDFIHWLNANHFDYHGLIEKGIALEAPEGMYKTI